ncbi:enoyl-CoA delta isomerase 1, mitochondrial [Nilaparvata lugens]|uniref:enoyl-CoA delta isomerase 1, mitochondrial n=1 Tax=Nilaparvata lugens TaxID=108931 RepID=UPI00193EA4A7|nr:enoyl-CoA delta isomerase 1, mitochondrial [Nilaparvata lugens]
MDSILDLLQSISTALTTLEKSKCRGMILTSDNPSVFSAGLDILEMYKPDPTRVKDFWTTLQDTWIKLYTTSFPTVAVINGHSPAGGCLLALSCEYRIIVGPKNTIGLNETKLGIIAPRWFQDSMRNVIGERQAELALTTGKMFTADEALKVNLVDEVVASKDEATGRAIAFLSQFAKIPPLPRKMTKLEFREATVNWLVNNKEKDLQIFLSYINQPKVQEGLGMYLESLKKKSAK